MWTFLFTSLESKTAALPLAIAPFMASPASKYTRLRVRAWRSWTCLSRWHRRSMDPTANGFWDKDGKDWQMVHHTSTIKHSPYHNYNSILKPCSIVLIVSRLQRVFWCKIISNRNLLTRRPGSINTVAPSLLSGRISLFWSTWANTWGQDQPDLGVCLDPSGPASRSLKHAKNGYKMIRNNLHQFSVKHLYWPKKTWSHPFSMIQTKWHKQPSNDSFYLPTKFDEIWHVHRLSEAVRIQTRQSETELHHIAVQQIGDLRFLGAETWTQGDVLCLAAAVWNMNMYRLYSKD